jgi:hypothetical protein
VKNLEVKLDRQRPVASDERGCRTCADVKKHRVTRLKRSPRCGQSKSK